MPEGPFGHLSVLSFFETSHDTGRRKCFDLFPSKSKANSRPVFQSIVGRDVRKKAIFMKETRSSKSVAIMTQSARDRHP